MTSHPIPLNRLRRSHKRRISLEDVLLVQPRHIDNSEFEDRTDIADQTLRRARTRARVKAPCDRQAAQSFDLLLQLRDGAALGRGFR